MLLDGLGGFGVLNLGCLKGSRLKLKGLGASTLKVTGLGLGLSYELSTRNGLGLALHVMISYFVGAHIG